MAPPGRKHAQAIMGKDDGKKWDCAKCGAWSWADRTTCFKCGAPRGKKQNGRGGGSAGEKLPSTITVGDFILVGDGKKERKQAKALERQLARLVELEAKEAGGGGSAPAKASVVDAEMDVDSGGVKDKTAIKALQKKIQQLKDVGPELRDQLCEGKGGYLAFLAELELELQQARAQQRVLRPLAQQKVSAEAHLQKMQKGRDEAASTLARLQEQQAELERKVAEQKVFVADAEDKLQKATVEAVAISERATAELRGERADVSIKQTSVATAESVKGFFESLPSAVSADPEGMQAIKQVMVLLEKLDAASQNAQAAQVQSDQREAAHAAIGTGPMGLDEEVLSQMADFAVAPAGDGEGEAEARQARVEEAKARLRSKKGDLEEGIAKARKIGK